MLYSSFNYTYWCYVISVQILQCLSHYIVINEVNIYFYVTALKCYVFYVNLVHCLMTIMLCFARLLLSKCVYFQSSLHFISLLSD